MAGSMAYGVGADSSDLESKLAGFVRSYINVSGRGDCPERQAALRSVCSALEWLLGGLLQKHEVGRFYLVDGIIPAQDMLPDPVKVLSPVELTVRGLAICVENVRGSWWIEPFFASLQISDVSG